jgi:hypothetical protein
MARRARHPKQKLIDHISAAFEQEKRKRQILAARFSEVIIPQINTNFHDLTPMVRDVAKKLGSLGKSKAEIRWRLKHFSYPYELGGNNNLSFYEFARRHRVLGLLSTGDLLWNTRRFWTFRAYDEYYRTLGSKAPDGQSLEFHKTLLHELANHLDRVETVSQAYRVPGPVLEGYRSVVLKQLLREAVAYYPELPMRYIPANKLTTPLRRIEAQYELFSALHGGFRAANFDSRKFAYQLTALIVTPRDHIRNHNELRPTPVTVRRNVEMWIKRINSGKKVTTRP